MTMVLFKKAKEMIDAAEHILLVSDDKIDGDTIGSTLGMYHVLKARGKEVEVYSPKSLIQTLKFLPGIEVIQRDPKIFEYSNFDLVIVFDSAIGKSITDNKAHLYSTPIIAFDHHISNYGYADLDIIEPEAASASDIVWRFIKSQKFSMNPEAAQCILTGIITDTDVFYTRNTTIESVDAATELAKEGARLQIIVRETMMKRSIESLKLWGLALERLYFNKEFNAIATAITEEDIKKLKVDGDDIGKLSEFLHAMTEGAETILVLRELSDGSVKGSLRSCSRDVSVLAEKKYGGGGHRCAAGFKVKEARLKDHDGQWRIVRS